MQGLEEQAQAEARLLIERLYTHQVLEVKHSSRDSLMERICEALCQQDKPLATLTLVFRSGLSPASLHRLQEVLRREPADSPIQELEFVGLRTEQEISLALECANINPRITRLRLENYRPAGRLSREDRQSMADVLRQGMFDNMGHHVTCMELVGYPLGADGARILAESVAQNKTLNILRLQDCDLRSDSMYYVAQMIRGNNVLRELDLSYNRHYLGSPLTREMTIKTLINKGLKYNYTLQALGMRQTRGGPIERSKIDTHLAVNRFRHDFIANQRDLLAIPTAAWPQVLARVTAKPTALHQFLRETFVALFT